MPAELLAKLGLTAGVATASGLRLYGTVAALGLLHRTGALRLPAGLESLAELPIIIIAGVLYVVEFVADKIPAFDSVWDSIHTFIRVPAAAVLAYAAFGPVDESWRIGAALLCGTIALSSHAIKASSRLAINASPEPLSNWAASFSEEAIVFGLIWLAVTHPIAALVVGLLTVVVAVLLASWIIRMMRRVLARRPRSA
ncbi:MAG: DUF4126 domain-containing protein [Thermoanaerobaculia bacterium]